MTIKKSRLVILIICVFVVGTALGFAGPKFLSFMNIGWENVSMSEYNHMKYMTEKYAKAEKLWQEAADDFYRDVDEKKMEEGMYKGIMAGLQDPYSGYMTRSEYESWLAALSGEYEGIGITFEANEKGRAEVVSVIDGGPADRAGLKSGDIISSVDGKMYDDMDKMAAAVRGKSGSDVKLKYIRNGKEKKVTITRSKIVHESVTSKMLKDNIGYIKVSEFEDNTYEDFKVALDKMEVKNVKGLVIDMRNNSGGLVEEGAKIADELEGNGTIAYTKDGHGKKEYIRSDESVTDIPYIVLINEGSASTTEVVAASIKDNGPGKLLGTKTFGKGIIQTTKKLKDGSAYKLTVMQFFSPDGNTIHKKGVRPDYLVKGKDNQLQRAVFLLQ